jgi:hypothetical protein
MTKNAGIITIITMMVIATLISGCITETSPPHQKQEINQTNQRPLRPPDPPQQPGPAGQKTGELQFAGNFSAPAGTCLLHTKSNAECKDCCDCLPGDADTRKNCRDACAANDFSPNTDFITVSPVSVWGPGGNYSACADAGSETACKECCDGSPALSCGDRRFCRDVCNAKGDGVQPSVNP